jgi:hypothetical protein
MLATLIIRSQSVRRVIRHVVAAILIAIATELGRRR